MANTMMQKFWDSALALEPPDDCDTQRYASLLIMSLNSCSPTPSFYWFKNSMLMWDCYLIGGLWDRCYENAMRKRNICANAYCITITWRFYLQWNVCTNGFWWDRTRQVYISFSWSWKFICLQVWRSEGSSASTQLWWVVVWLKKSLQESWR